MRCRRMKLFKKTIFGRVPIGAGPDPAQPKILEQLEVLGWVWGGRFAAHSQSWLHDSLASWASSQLWRSSISGALCWRRDPPVAVKRQIALAIWHKKLHFVPIGE